MDDSINKKHHLVPLGTKVSRNPAEADSSACLPRFSFCEVYSLHVLSHAILKFLLKEPNECTGKALLPPKQPSPRISTSVTKHKLLGTPASAQKPQLAVPLSA